MVAVTVGRYAIETTGKPEFEGLERSVQRLVDQMYGDARDLESAAADASAYSGSGSPWAPPRPATTQEAIARLATAVSGLLGGPIP